MYCSENKCKNLCTWYNQHNPQTKYKNKKCQNACQKLLTLDEELSSEMSSACIAESDIRLSPPAAEKCQHNQCAAYIAQINL